MAANMVFAEPATPGGEFAALLKGRRIHYMPTCVIVEMMTRLYSDIFAIAHAGIMNRAVPTIVQRLGGMRDNLLATAAAYRAEATRFFTGDWREDKLRARRVFHNIMLQLKYCAGMIGREERRDLYDAVVGMTAEWIALDRVLDAAAARKGGHRICRYFRNCKPDSWKQTMANVILTLDEDAEYGRGDSLVLLCFERMKRLLLATIDGMERRRGTPGKFNPDRILAVSGEDVPFSCLTCLELTDSLGTQAMDADYPASLTAEGILSPKKQSGVLRPRPRYADGAAARAASPKAGKQGTLEWLRSALGIGSSCCAAP